MIDFRYHAMSLVAVFVALAVGLLLGVTIGDTNLLSNVQGNLEESLKDDVNEAREQASNTKDQIERQNEFIASAYPQLVDGRLSDQRVATIGSAATARDTLRSVTTAVEPAGASVRYIAQLLEKPQYEKIASELGISDLLSGADTTPQQTDQLGRAVGRRLARGRDKDVMRRLVFSRLSGDIVRVRLVAYARQVPAETDTGSKEWKLFDGFERGIVAGLAQQVDRVAGVEETTTEPTNIKWYNSLGLSTVDDIQDFAGFYSLVLIFDGAKGDYGTKDSADAIVPQTTR